MELDEVLERLPKGPTILFLGQRYMSMETGSDPIIAEVIKKYKPATSNPDSYTSLLDAEEATPNDAKLAWIDERCKRIGPPEWLKTIAGYQWNAVFSSAIDSIWPVSFRNSWREINLILEEKYYPSDPRNRFMLHCVSLFGCVNKIEDGERPPLNEVEVTLRKPVAVSLARRIPDILTPWGTLLIEGYSPETDWFSIQDLLPVLYSLNPGQAHIFSADEKLAKDPTVAMLVAKRKLCLHKESLARLLSLGQDTAVITLGVAPHDIGAEHRILLKTKTLSVPSDVWRQTAKSALILDDTALEPPSPISADVRYREFRTFLSGQDGKAKWKSYARNFHFKREFEAPLFKEVEARLRSRTLSDDPIIVHGQTGLGKTVALGALAYEICKTREFPVLYIERRTQRPAAPDLVQFCKWAEGAGAPACLIVWDGMLEPREYSHLLKTLSGRGRKVVLVGSSYKLDYAPKDNPRYIPVPTKLTKAEQAGFARFLESFHPSIGKLMPKHADETFLVALYRLLPATRPPIRGGVLVEVGQAEKQLIINSSKTVNHHVPTTVLGQALLNAKLITEKELDTVRTVKIDGEEISEPQKLTGLIMVPGRFGFNVPFELLLRAMGKNSYSTLPDLLKGLDIIRWQTDQIGNIEIGARSSLEAQLIVESRFGGSPKAEIEFARELILELKGDGTQSGGTEINFAIDLVRAMGAQGKSKDYFSPCFNDLAKALTSLRKDRNVENPRLMLQEANLWRQWIAEQSKAGKVVPLSDGILKENEVILNRAIELVGDNLKAPEFLSHLFSELASNIATKARQDIKNDKNHSESVVLYKKARQLLVDARNLDPENYYPTGIIAGLAGDLIKSGRFTEMDKAEAIADVLHAFQLTGAQELSADQQDNFQSSRLRFGEVTGNQDLSQEAFDRLAAQGSGAGYFLRALKMSGLGDKQDVVVSDILRNLSAALLYLEANMSKIGHDTRCLELYFDVWWMVNTQTRLFEGERIALPLDSEKWNKCLEIVSKIEGAGKSSRELRMLFLRGLANFHMGAIEESLSLFKDLLRESEQLKGRLRIMRSYVASSPGGKPLVFHGNVRWVNQTVTRGEVYVDELRRNFTFMPRDFGNTEIRQGESLGEFHIAFNFLGPAADPVGAYRNKAK